MDEEIKETPEQESSEVAGTEPAFAEVGDVTSTEDVVVEESEEVI